MKKIFEIHRDVFSNGQIDSKLWLCRELEKLGLIKPQRIWILGGWYATTAFLLLSREKLPIDHIRSYDIDPSCEAIADMINENWCLQDWKFKAFTADGNNLEYLYRADHDKPNLVINTSCEHFDSMGWFNRIPSGTLVALQSNNLKHDEDTNAIDDLNQMILNYPLTDIQYSGSLNFSYVDKSFSRFMIIGNK
jgi:hypothetical protein